MLRIKLFVVLALSALAVVFSGCTTAQYLVHVAGGQMALYNRQVPIEEAQQNLRLPAATRRQLAKVRPLKDYVEKKLGVRATANYRHFVQLERPYVVWALTVAKSDALELKEWSFPIVGSFPYLGFFDQDRARSWQKRWEAKGYDTYLRGVTAYSTLGYLPDPLLSSMLRGDDGDLANLVFHETVHAHVFVKGGGAFNEQIATLIGDLGELLWLKENSATPGRLRLWQDQRADRRRLALLVREFADSLRKAYSNAAQTVGGLQALGELKRESFARFKEALNRENWRVPAMAGYAKIFDNHAAVLAHLTYEDNADLFESVASACKQDLPALLKLFKAFEASERDLKRPAVDAFREWYLETGRRVCLDL
jgi:predicted aminopeptidase